VAHSPILREPFLEGAVPTPMRTPSLLLAAFLALPAVALAQSEDAPPPPAEPNIQYKAITDIDFTTQRVDASLLKPYGQYISGLPQRDKKPLMTLKTDFNAEMRASADSIR